MRREETKQTLSLYESLFFALAVFCSNTKRKRLTFVKQINSMRWLQKRRRRLFSLASTFFASLLFSWRLFTLIQLAKERDKRTKKDRVVEEGAKQVIEEKRAQKCTCPVTQKKVSDSSWCKQDLRIHTFDREETHTWDREKHRHRRRCSFMRSNTVTLELKSELECQLLWLFLILRHPHPHTPALAHH